MMRFNWTRLPCLLMVLLLCSCGGGGNGGSSSSLLTGVFIDSAVVGLSYRTTSVSGITDQDGTFKYREGEHITFSVGEVLLGSSVASGHLTPVDLVPGALDATDIAVTNIARLLQSLDFDGNPDNGITIPETLSAALLALDLDFSSPQFAYSAEIISLFKKLNDENRFPERRRLVSSARALAHLTGNSPAPDSTISSNRVEEVIEEGIRFSSLSDDALAFDSLNQPHIIVGGNHLYHLSRENSVWKYEVIEDELEASHLGGGTVEGVFMDNEDNIHLIYADHTGKKYITTRPGFWWEEDLVNRDELVVVDRSGFSHHLMYEAGIFTYHTNAGGVERIETFPIGLDGDGAFPGTGETAEIPLPPWYTKFKVDSQGAAHVVFTQVATHVFRESTLKYATNRSGVWKTETLDYKFGVLPEDLSLMVDSAGVPYVVYTYQEVIVGSRICSGSCENEDRIMYFTNKNGDWQVEVVSDDDYLEELAFFSNSNNGLNFIMGDGSSRLLHAIKGAGGWEFDDVFPAPPSNGLSTPPSPLASLVGPRGFAPAEDSLGVQTIGHLSNSQLYFNKLINGVWESEAAGLPQFESKFPVITLTDNADQQHVVYWDSANGVMKYAYSEQGTWQIETIGAAAELSRQFDAVVDAQGNIYVAYSDVENDVLKMASRISGNWILEDVLVANDIVSSIALTVDVFGNLHLAYWRWRERAWFYATNISGEWQFSQFAAGFTISTRDAPAYINALSNGDVIIVFRSPGQTIGELAKGWHIARMPAGELVWEVGNAGLDADIEGAGFLIEDSGVLHAAYQRLDPDRRFYRQLMYAKRDNNAWSHQLVVNRVSTSTTQPKIAMVLIDAVNPVISYYYGSEGEMRYAYNSGDNWDVSLLINLNTYNTPEFRATMSADSSGRLSTAYYRPASNSIEILTIQSP